MLGVQVSKFWGAGSRIPLSVGFFHGVTPVTGGQPPQKVYHLGSRGGKLDPPDIWVQPELILHFHSPTYNWVPLSNTYASS